MTKIFSISLEDQLSLRIEQELSRTMDNIIPTIQLLAKEFGIATLDKKSPFRNILAVSVETGSSLEVIKNYIRYQVGRSGASPIWKHKSGGRLFAEALVEQINSLSKNVTEVLDQVKSEISKEHELVDYLHDRQSRVMQDLHLKMTQKYLGYLAREHTALVGLDKQNNDSENKGKQHNSSSKKVNYKRSSL